MTTTSNDVWVFIETTQDGDAKNVGLELLTAAKPIAEGLGGRSVALIIGYQIDLAIKKAGQCGADLIIAADHKEFKHYFTGPYVDCFYKLVKEHSPNTVLIGATGNGRDMAPRISCRLKTGLTADCTGIEFDHETKNVLWVRPTLGGNLMATIECPDQRPQMGTVRPGVYKRPADDSNKPQIIYAEPSISPDLLGTQLIEEIIQPSSQCVNLEEAEIVIAGGLGLGSLEGFKVLEDFAYSIGASVAATRSVIDKGWAPLPQQVGQTGKCISPKLYIACGISGAVHHLAGISGADCLVAINSDPDANIFNAADYGIVGDIFEILPTLKSELLKIKNS